jgi:hypothetical protein
MRDEAILTGAQCPLRKPFEIGALRRPQTLQFVYREMRRRQCVLEIGQCALINGTV